MIKNIKKNNDINTTTNGWGGGGRFEEVVGLYKGFTMNIVDKLTPNSKTVVNTGKKKHFECYSSCY